MQPMLPQELSDMIIDHLHNDVAALLSAGLVCKSWFPESRFLLFSNMKLSVCDLYNTSGLIPEAICAEGSTIPPYILHLEIENKGQVTKNVDLALLRLPPFSNLRSLSLGQIKWASLTGAKKCVTTMAQNITTLSLCYFTFETVDEAVDLIASAPCLENLIFWSVQCDDNMCNYSSRANAPPLRRIQIDMNPLTAAIINWFCRCYPTPSVHTLVIDEFTGLYIPTMCNFIRHLGSALENLTISCPFSESDFALSKQLDLSQNISLRNISFDSIILHADSPRSWTWMISIISRIPPCHRSLERVTMIIFLCNTEQINSLELSALDTLFLSQPLSHNSTKLCFTICGGVDMDAVRSLIKDNLPGLVGKGRLEL